MENHHFLAGYINYFYRDFPSFFVEKKYQMGIINHASRATEKERPIHQIHRANPEL